MYLKRIVQRGTVSKKRLEEILPTHFIKPKSLYQDDFDVFLLDRASKLLDAIAKAMGKPITGRDSEEVKKEFGDVL